VNGKGRVFDTRVRYRVNLYASVFQYSQNSAISFFLFPENTTINQFMIARIKIKYLQSARIIPETIRTIILNHASFLSVNFFIL